MSRILGALFAFAIAAFVIAAWPAEAQTQDTAGAQTKAKKQRTAYRNTGTVFYSRDEYGRARTRIIVQKRSYLDGGTEVLPGERKFTDYAIPPNYSALENALGPGQGFRSRSYSSPSPWDIPGIGLSF